MPDTLAQRQARWRERQRLGIPWQPPTCQQCGGSRTAAHDPLCSRCRERWTPEGRAAKTERVRRSRAKEKRVTAERVRRSRAKRKRVTDCQAARQGV